MIDCLSRFIIHFGTNLGATHTFNINLLIKLSDVFGVTLQCKWRYFLRKNYRGSLSLETHSFHNLSTRQIKFRFFSMK